MLDFCWRNWSRKAALLINQSLATKRRVPRRGLARLEHLEDRALLSAAPAADTKPHVFWFNFGAPEEVEGNTGAKEVPLKLILSPGKDNKDVKVTVSIHESGSGPGFASDGDFEVKTVTVTLGKNKLSAIIPATIFGDTVPELNETFTATITSASGAVIDGPDQDVLIKDDDLIVIPPGKVGVSLKETTVQTGTEGGQTNFTLVLTDVAQVPINVEVGLTGTPPTGTAAATIPDDAGLGGALTKTVTIPAGVKEQTFAVDLVDDTVLEKLEGYTISINSAADPAVIAGVSSAKGTITDNDAPPTVTIEASHSTTEGNQGTSQGIILVKLDHATSQDVVVTYMTTQASNVPKNQRAGKDDFTTVKKNTVTILAGQTSTEIKVDIKGDTTAEPDESFAVKLKQVSKNAKLDPKAKQGNIVIVNDD